MNRLRIGLVGSFIIGCFYAAFGLFDSLGKFAAGIIVACISISITTTSCFGITRCFNSFFAFATGGAAA